MREKILLALFALSFPVVAYLSTLPPQRFRNDVTQWSNRASVAFADFSEYREQFGANEHVLLSWPGCDLNDPRIETVTTSIETEFPDQVCRVSNGQRAYWSLRDDAKLIHEAAIERLQNVFIGEANEETAVGFQFTEKGRLDRSGVLLKLESMLESAGVEPAEVVYAGLGHNLYTLDKEGLESPFRMVPQIMLLALILTVLFVRNIWLAFFINALGTYTGCLSFNFVWLADVNMNAIIWPLPTLTMLLTISAALHFLSYYRKAVEACRQSGVLAPVAEMESHQRELMQSRAVAKIALRFSIKPILCCTITTVIGLLSLMLSTSEPVRQFGMFGAMSMTAANLLLLVWFPPLLTLIGYSRRLLDSNAVQTELSPKHDRWSRWVSFTRDGRWWIVSTCLAAIVLGAIGISKVKTGSRLDNFFPADHQVLSSAAEMQSRVGPLNSVELLLDFNNVDSKHDRQRLRGLQALAAKFSARTDFESSLSAGTFSPHFQRRRGALAETVERTRLEKFKEELIQAGLVYADPKTNREVWRVSCRYSIFDNIDLAEQTALLEEIVEELFYSDDELVLPGESLSVTTTGEFVLFDLVDRQFFDELMRTYFTAFIVIMLVMFSVLKSLRTSLIALLPNLFPALVVLGAAGFLGCSLDVASLMTASVALGIAVDDTLHFLMWNQEVRNSQKAGEVPEDAVESAVRYCGKAMLQTSVILGLSIVLYAFCGFLPTVRFGILLSAMLFAALVGDLLLLPALLAIAEKKEAEHCSE